MSRRLLQDMVFLMPLRWQSSKQSDSWCGSPDDSAPKSQTVSCHKTMQKLGRLSITEPPEREGVCMGGEGVEGVAGEAGPELGLLGGLGPEGTGGVLGVAAPATLVEGGSPVYQGASPRR